MDYPPLERVCQLSWDRESMHSVTKQHDQGVRVLQSFAILMVVLGHFKSPLGPIIFSFHMPLFFFLGGLFINPNRNVNYFIKFNAKRLLGPFMLFGFIGLVITLLKNLLLHRPTINIYDSLSGLLYWMDAPHLEHYGFVLWFLPALFWGRLMVFTTFRYITNPMIAYFLVLTVFVGITFLPFSLPFGLDNGMNGSVWIAAGYMFYRYCNLTKLRYSFIAGCVIATSVASMGIQPLDLAYRQIGNPWITLPYTLSVAVLLLQISKVLADRLQLFRSDLVSLIGANTLLILVAHPYTNNAAYLIGERITNNGWYLEFVITLAMLWALLRIKSRCSDNKFFQYV